MCVSVWLSVCKLRLKQSRQSRCILSHCDLITIHGIRKLCWPSEHVLGCTTNKLDFAALRCAAAWGISAMRVAGGSRPMNGNYTIPNEYYWIIPCEVQRIIRIGAVIIYQLRLRCVSSAFPLFHSFIVSGSPLCVQLNILSSFFPSPSLCHLP